MPARKTKLIHPKYHHHIHFTTLIGGIIIFLVLVFMLSKLNTMKNGLARTGTKPTCLKLDASVMKKDNINYLTFDSEISVPYPKDAKIECRLRYQYQKDEDSKYGTITYSHPADLENQACLGEFPLIKPPKDISSVEVQIVPYNLTSQIEGNTCITSVTLPPQ